MLSTGNDIVSINATNVTRAKQPNFYSKILTPTETTLYSDPRFALIPLEIFVWLLWSIKESAFKYLQRIDPAVLFTPVKFEVKEIYMPDGFKLVDFSLNELTGVGFDDFSTIKSTINFGDELFYCNSLVYQEFISTVVNDDGNFSKVYWGIKHISNINADIQSSEVRKFAINSLKKALNDNDVIINKNEHAIPVALQGNGEIIPLSLSHHENWVGYSFTL